MNKTSENIIRIVASKAEYRVAPFFVTPSMGKNKKYKTGQENLTETELKKQTLKIDPEESYPVKHNMVLDLSIEQDKIMYNFLVTKDDIIAASKKDVVPGVHHFYFEDKEVEAKMDVAKADLEYEAETLIRKMSSVEAEDFARMLGEPVKSMRPVQVQAALKKKARLNPQLIIDALQDKDKDYKIMLNRLVDADVIAKKDGGKYYNGAELIGINEFYAVQFLKDKKNVDLVNQWMQLIASQEVAE